MAGRLEGRQEKRLGRQLVRTYLLLAILAIVVVALCVVVTFMGH
jgi:hypothetical protein